MTCDVAHTVVIVCNEDASISARNKPQKKKQWPEGLSRDRKIQGCIVEHHFQLSPCLLLVFKFKNNVLLTNWCQSYFSLFFFFFFHLIVCICHYNKIPPTCIWTQHYLWSWVKGLAKGLLNQPHPDSENINVYLLLFMIINFHDNLHIEGGM